MAKRPVFVPNLQGNPTVMVEMVEFEWFPGLSIAQKQRSIASLHRSAGKTLGVSRFLEISSKSCHPCGVDLSAFNLTVTIPGKANRVSVESIYQSSKVFEDGGPFLDLLDQPAGQGRKDPRLKQSGRLVHFDFLGRIWPPDPETFFYDWIYFLALKQQPRLAKRLLDHDGFTDIEFNPKKSLNCQAHAAALFCALAHHRQSDEIYRSPAAFKRIYSHKPNAYRQLPLF